MKRSWFGLGLLVVLLAGAILVGTAMDDIQRPVAADLRRAAILSEEDWEAAKSLAAMAEDRWSEKERFCACFADHTPLEEIRQGFAELRVYADSEETPHFAAQCAQLSQRVEAVAKAHGLTWGDFL